MSGGRRAEREQAAHHDDEEIRHSGERRNDAQRWVEKQFEGLAPHTTLSCCRPVCAYPHRNLP